MNRLEQWLLKKLIRKMMQLRLQNQLFKIIWNEAKTVFHEDNIHTRHAELTIALDTHYDAEMLTL